MWGYSEAEKRRIQEERKRAKERARAAKVAKFKREQRQKELDAISSSYEKKYQAETQTEKQGNGFMRSPFGGSSHSNAGFRGPAYQEEVDPIFGESSDTSSHSPTTPKLRRGGY